MQHNKNLRHRLYTLPKGCNVAEIVMRETNGHDDLEAARNARTKQALTDEEARAHSFDESCRIAIVAVRRKAGGPLEQVSQPFEEIDDWNSKTRRLVADAFIDLNSLPAAELEAFRKAATDWNGEAEDEGEGAEIVEGAPLARSRSAAAS